MRKVKVLSLFVIVLMAGSLARSESLDEARRLYEAGSAEAALSEINNILDSDATDTDKAAALDLLGTIAVDKGHLTIAKQAWTRLLEEYPAYSESRDVGTKLRLVSALVESEKPAPEVETVQPPAPAAPEEPAGPAMPVVESSPVPPAPAPAETEASKQAAVTPAPVTASPGPTGLVLVAARGKPHDAVMEMSGRIVSLLRDQRVDAESATGGIPVVEESKMVLPMLLQKGQADGAGSVLLLTADYVSMQKMILDCYSPDGAKLWRLKISGGTGWKGRPYSKTGITEELAERFLDKLREKVGEPGLPVTLD